MQERTLVSGTLVLKEEIIWLVDLSFVRQCPCRGSVLLLVLGLVVLPAFTFALPLPFRRGRGRDTC
eukprot:11219505-Lingulodinium_polyedra.AAC.1